MAQAILVVCETHFRRELAYRSSDKGYHDAADGVEYGIAG
jgi:hypothetical protein